MAKNIQMNVLGSDGQYEDIYPQTLSENVIDLQDTLNNYYTKEETLNPETAVSLGLQSNAIPDEAFQLFNKNPGNIIKNYPVSEGKVINQGDIVDIIDGHVDSSYLKTNIEIINQQNELNNTDFVFNTGESILGISANNTNNISYVILNYNFELKKQGQLYLGSNFYPGYNDLNIKIISKNLFLVAAGIGSTTSSQLTGKLFLYKIQPDFSIIELSNCGFNYYKQSSGQTAYNGLGIIDENNYILFPSQKNQLIHIQYQENNLIIKNTINYTVGSNGSNIRPSFSDVIKIKDGLYFYYTYQGSSYQNIGLVFKIDNQYNITTGTSTNFHGEAISENVWFTDGTYMYFYHGFSGTENTLTKLNINEEELSFSLNQTKKLYFSQSINGLNRRSSIITDLLGNNLVLISGSYDGDYSKKIVYMIINYNTMELVKYTNFQMNTSGYIPGTIKIGNKQYMSLNSYSYAPVYILNDDFSGVPQINSYQGIALESGTFGDNINIIFQGNLENNIFNSDQEFISNGVYGYNFNNILNVVPYWNTQQIKKSSVKIESGNYTGTGTYGSSNPNSLTFGFVPKIVIVSPTDGIKFSYYGNSVGFRTSFIWQYGNTNITIINGSVYTLTLSLSGNTLSWYSNSSLADEQCNAGGVKYYYLAIG